MNIDTGELMRMDELGKRFAEHLKKSVVPVRTQEDFMKGQGWEPVPEELQEEANRELGDKDSTFVDLNKDTPLTKWAAIKRAEIEATKMKARKAEKKKNKRNTAKESRRVNRKK